MVVDLNVDLGELPGEADELYALATVANIACGGHAGDEASMRHAVELCLRYGTAVSAHPSYPDREGFGRQSLEIELPMLYEALVDQCETLSHIAKSSGAKVRFAKLHGALYHDAAASPDIAAAALDGIVNAFPDGLVIVGPPSGALMEGARARGLGYAREGFADRRYAQDGKLLPRSRPNALILDPSEAAEQALALAKSKNIETLCVHGDTEGALEILRAVRDALSREKLLREKG